MCCYQDPELRQWIRIALSRKLSKKTSAFLVVTSSPVSNIKLIDVVVFKFGFRNLNSNLVTFGLQFALNLFFLSLIIYFLAPENFHMICFSHFLLLNIYLPYPLSPYQWLCSGDSNLLLRS